MTITTHRTTGAANVIRLANLAARLAQDLARERANNRLLLSILAGRPIGDRGATAFGGEQRERATRSEPNGAQ